MLVRISGIFGHRAGLVGCNGRVHAFEPLPECFARLQRNLSSFRWTSASPLAAGGITGTATIHFNDHELGWGSLLSENDLIHAVDVQVTTLDDWAERQHIQSVHFIKIDAEGAEYQILEGARRLLRDFRPVIAAELNAVCLRRDHRSPAEVVRFLQSADYKAFSFNDGVLAIPREAKRILWELRAYTKHSFVGDDK